MNGDIFFFFHFFFSAGSKSFSTVSVSVNESSVHFISAKPDCSWPFLLVERSQNSWEERCFIVTVLLGRKRIQRLVYHNRILTDTKGSDPTLETGNNLSFDFLTHPFSGSSLRGCPITVCLTLLGPPFFSFESYFLEFGGSINANIIKSGPNSHLTADVYQKYHSRLLKCVCVSGDRQKYSFTYSKMKENKIKRIKKLNKPVRGCRNSIFYLANMDKRTCNGA